MRAAGVTPVFLSYSPLPSRPVPDQQQQQQRTLVAAATQSASSASLSASNNDAAALLEHAHTRSMASSPAADAESILCVLVH